MKPEDRQFVVDSRASLNKLSREDLNSAELDTLRASRTLATVITANGEVQTNEEATVYVYDLDLFVTVQIIEGTLAAVLSLVYRETLLAHHVCTRAGTQFLRTFCSLAQSLLSRVTQCVADA